MSKRIIYGETIIKAPARLGDALNSNPIMRSIDKQRQALVTMTTESRERQNGKSKDTIMESKVAETVSIWLIYCWQWIVNRQSRAHYFGT